MGSEMCIRDRLQTCYTGVVTPPRPAVAISRSRRDRGDPPHLINTIDITISSKSIPLTSLFVQINTIDITLPLKSIHVLGQLRSIKCLSQRIIILTIVLITRSGNAVFTISGGSAVYSSRSNFTEFDTNNLEHKSAFKIDHNSNSILIQN